MMQNLNTANVVCFTEHYSFRATVVTGTKRLSDLMNDKSSAFMELSNVSIYRIAQLNTPVMETEEFYLKKQSIALVAILKEETNTRASRIYSYVPRQKRPVVLVLPSFEVRGNLHLHSKWETYGLVGREGESFLPVTEAMATSTFNAKVNFKAATILVQESLLSGFYLEDQK